jgi:hypothetical protein
MAWMASRSGLTPLYAFLLAMFLGLPDAFGLTRQGRLHGMLPDSRA